MLRTYAIGPIGDPCTKLALISRILDIAYLHCCTLCSDGVNRDIQLASCEYCSESEAVRFY